MTSFLSYRGNKNLDGRKDGRKDGRTEGRTDGRKDGRTDGGHFHSPPLGRGTNKGVFNTNKGVFQRYDRRVLKYVCPSLPYDQGYSVAIRQKEEQQLLLKQFILHQNIHIHQK